MNVRANSLILALKAIEILMRKLALALIVIESTALILLGIYAKVQSSRAEINALAAQKQQQLYLEQQKVLRQLADELTDCRSTQKPE